MHKAIFITVRTGSTRLPNKSLLEIKGKSTIEHLIDRVKQTHLVDNIVSLYKLFTNFIIYLFI